MKRWIYFICFCTLMVLVCEELNKNRQDTDPVAIETGSDQVVVTAHLASQVKKENQRDRKIAYVTFDDGPSCNTEEILQILQEKKAVATFFLISDNLTEKRQKSVKKLIAQGNEVGIHTACHEHEIMYKNETAFMKDFMTAYEKIEKTTGVKPKVQRFPWGSNNGFVRGFVDSATEKMHEMGVKSFDWSVSGEDAVRMNVSTAEIIANVKKDLTRFQYPIILLHDSGGAKNTPKALPRILDYIRQQGYEFGVLSDRDEYQFPKKWRK